MSFFQNRYSRINKTQNENTQDIVFLWLKLKYVGQLLIKMYTFVFNFIDKQNPRTIFFLEYQYLFLITGLLIKLNKLNIMNNTKYLSFIVNSF